MAMTPAEEWAATTGKEMFAAHMAKAAQKAWRDAVPSVTFGGRRSLFFWLGADGDTD